MSGNTIGEIFKVTTFGESHGRGIGVIVDGIPPYMELCEADVQKDLNRRRPGQSKVSTPREEKDQVEILSGVFEGRTMGPPVAMLIRNQNQDPSAYTDIKHKFRPGHADYGYYAKYGVRDWRGSGRASGRETACRVAAGAIAKKILAERGVTITGFSREIDGIRAETMDLSIIEDNIVRTCDPAVAEAMIEAIEAAGKAGDSVGGILEVHIKGCPIGLGNPIFDKLEAKLGQAFLSVGAVKGVEFGAGFDIATMKGSEYNDAFSASGDAVSTDTNNCGGIIGGISTGGDIVIRAAIRPPASIEKSQRTINVDKGEEDIQVFGRHDPCIVPRAVPVLEAMAAIVLVDAMLIQDAYDKYKCSEREAAEFMKREYQGYEPDK